MLAYPFLQTTLPPLSSEAAPSLSFDDLMVLFQDNLSRGDWEKVQQIRLFFDLRNMVESSSRSLLFPYGNYSKEDLQQLIMGEDVFDQDIFDMIKQYDTPDELRRHFYPILTHYLQMMIKKEKAFVKEFFTFEHQLRVLLAAYRAKRAGVPLLRELNFEDLADPYVMEILEQKDTAKFEFPYGFEGLQAQLEAAPSPQKEHEVLFRFKFHHFQKYLDEDYHSIDSLLAYMIQLIYLEGYYQLDMERGLEITQQLLKEKQ